MGPSLEKMHGSMWIMLIYLAAVMAGSISTAVANPRVYVCGCSDGVYALITAHFANALFNWQEMKFASIKTFGFIIFAVYSLWDSIVGIYRFDQSV